MCCGESPHRAHPYPERPGTAPSFHGRAPRPGINSDAIGVPRHGRKRRAHMAQLKGTKTHGNLKHAFAGESQANRRYLYFAKVADVEGYPEVAANFRETAEGETGHAHGHLDFLKSVGDPATGLPLGDTVNNLKASVAGETHEYTDMY